MFRISLRLKNRLKKAHMSIPIEKHLGLEVLELLSSCFVRDRLSMPNFDDPLKNLESVKILSLVQNDIILRLCKFRDTDSRSVSFDQVLKARRKSMGQEDITRIKHRIDKYRKLTRNLDEHRNAYIAHIAKRDRTHLRPPAEIKEVVRTAVEISDMLAGERTGYKLHDVDLRAEVLDEKSST